MTDSSKACEKNDSSQTKPDYVLLGLGVILLLVPLIFVLIDHSSHDRSGFYLRVIAALGAGLVGASLPGLLHVKLPFARAGGALAIFLLVYAVNPPKQSVEAFSPERPESTNNNVSELPVISTDTDCSGSGQTPAIADAGVIENEKVWQNVLGISWVKPSDWLGKHYFLTIQKNLYVWPIEIDKKNKKAKFIINTDYASRSSGDIIVDNAWVKEGESLSFGDGDNDLRLTLVDIRQAGYLPTDATYIKVDKLVERTQ